MEQPETLMRLAADFGIPIGEHQMERLDRFLGWLRNEAVAAGGIGPNEAEHLADRHIGDSLTWLAPLAEAPRTMLDVGSGVGLPGIPLAIALPDTRVTLLDRSGRRCGLLRRAIRVLGLENTVVRQGDVASESDPVDVVTSRASLPPDELLPHLHRLTLVLGVVAGSAAGPVSQPGYETSKIVSQYLESPRWLLIMRPS